MCRLHQLTYLFRPTPVISHLETQVIGLNSSRRSNSYNNGIIPHDTICNESLTFIFQKLFAKTKKHLAHHAVIFHLNLHCYGKFTFMFIRDLTKLRLSEEDPRSNWGCFFYTDKNGGGFFFS